MKIVVVGLNHNTAPIQVRERWSFGPKETETALVALKRRFPEAELTLLSTCNRVELYGASTRDNWETGTELVAGLAACCETQTQDLQPYLYIYPGLTAVTHLFKVTSSLDSMVIGETQIVGQVKEGYHRACVAKCTGKILNRLFHSAFATSKEVHTTTAIARGRMSVAGVAVELAQQVVADIKNAKAVVLGAGQMGELLIKHLLHVDCRDITVVNRTHCKGRSVAKNYGVQALPWEALEAELIKADIVIGSVTVEDYLFRVAEFRDLVQQRSQRQSLLLVDIAVPRNFEPAINELENVYLFSIDDLAQVVDQNRDSRAKDVAVGKEIVTANAHEFMAWFEVRDLGPQIGQLKSALTKISQKEVDRFFVGPREAAHCRDTLEPMVKRVTNKMLYCMVQSINATAQERGPEEAAKLVAQMQRQAQRILTEEPPPEESSA